MLIFDLGLDVLYEITRNCDFMTIKNLTQANRNLHCLFTNHIKFRTLTQHRLLNYIKTSLNLFIRDSLNNREQKEFIRTRVVKFNKVDEHNFKISADIITRQCGKLYEHTHNIYTDREILNVYDNKFITRYILDCFDAMNTFIIK